MNHWLLPTTPSFLELSIIFGKLLWLVVEKIIVVALTCNVGAAVHVVVFIAFNIGTLMALFL